jgi:hypothetical protein
MPVKVVLPTPVVRRMEVVPTMHSCGASRNSTIQPHKRARARHAQWKAIQHNVSSPTCNSYTGPCTADTCCSTDGGNSNNSLLSCVRDQYNPTPKTCSNSGLCGTENGIAQCLLPTCDSYVGPCTADTCCSTDGGESTNGFVWCIGGQYNPTPVTCPSAPGNTGECTMVSNTAHCVQPECGSFLAVGSCTANTCCSADGGNSSGAFLWCIRDEYNPTPYICPLGLCIMADNPYTAQCTYDTC